MTEQSECPNGCGQTMQTVKHDKLFTGPDGQRVIGENLTFVVCSECGEEGTPPETMRLVEQFFSGNIKPDSIDDTPVIHEKTA